MIQYNANQLLMPQLVRDSEALSCQKNELDFESLDSYPILFHIDDDIDVEKCI